MTEPRIVGLVLVRDEDRFVEQVVRNVIDFCDELILVDHRSRDGTGAILARIADEHPDRVRMHGVRDSAVAHDLVAPLAGTPTWVLGVDGDELYEPERLRAFRPRVLGGEFDDWWLIRSHVLHTVALDESGRMARGYMAPPAPSIVKLHNFALLESWAGRHPDPLAGKEGLRFRPGREERKLELGKVYGWENSPLRCLHMCFVRRSSRDRRDRARLNVPDLDAPRRLPRRLWFQMRARAGLAGESPWKLEHYRAGEPVEVDATPFLAPHGRPAAG